VSPALDDADARAPKSDFAQLPDLVSRRFGGSVLAASDELFAERENLIKPEAPTYRSFTFGHKGQVYDGWETRRRREAGSDWALIRLGIAGVIKGVVVDTAFFTGNYPPIVSVDAAGIEGYPTADELNAAPWTTIVARSPVTGHALNEFGVDMPQRFTHVRLWMHPDGGIARLRVHGDPVADPRLLPGSGVDLAALANGARITGCSNMFFSSPSNLIAPGQARVMGEGWETARRRNDGNDWVELRLAGPGVIRHAEIDTSYFLGNAPGWAALSGRTTAGGSVQLLPRTRLQPDTVHVFRLAGRDELDRVRIDVFPDGGLARLRLRGELTGAGRQALALRWFNLLPEAQAIDILQADGGLDASAAARLALARPVQSTSSLPAPLQSDLACRPGG
jgi:allantoicase